MQPARPHLWADTTVTSQATPNSSRISAAPFMVARSESDPMMMPTDTPPLPPPPLPACRSLATLLLAASIASAAAAGKQGK